MCQRDRINYLIVGGIPKLPTLCVECGKPVESVRECYAIPTCYACLPPPPPLKVIYIGAHPHRCFQDGVICEGSEEQNE